MEQTDKLFDELIEKVLEYNSNSNTELIRKAYVFVEKAFSWKIKKSWESYVSHALHTALNLTRIRWDDTSIISALLHDILSTKMYSFDDIVKIFGDEVWKIVDWVSKLSQVHYSPDMTRRDIELLRDTFTRVWKIVKILLVKICDRMHVLSKMEILDESKKLRIAIETLDIYVPIVNLLSIWVFIWELEDLSFKYIKPKEYDKLFKIISKKYADYEIEAKNIYAKIIPRLGKYCSDVTVIWKVKSIYSIYKKMNLVNIPFEGIYDVVLFNVEVKSREECYIALWIIHSIFKVKGGR